MIVPFAGSIEGARGTLTAMQRIAVGSDDELILADNSAKGNALEAAQGSPVTVVPATIELSSYHARNIGAESASCEWLLFMDADCVPDPQLLDLYFAAVVPDACGAIAGRVRPAEGQRSLVARYARSRTHIDEEPLVKSGFRPAGITPNLLLRRAAYRSVGGFQEGLASGADVEICWRIQDAGWTLLHRPEALVQHRHVETIGGLALQCRRHAAGRAWVNRRYPGSMPRPKLTRRFLHALGGTAYRALRLQGRRSLFRLIDAFWFCVDSFGYLLGNRATRARPAAQPPEDVPARTPVVFVCDAFPAVSETFIASEAEGLIAAGHRVRIESGARPERPDPLVRRSIANFQLEDDGIAAKLASAGLLCLRHPLRCARDASDRRRWVREEGVWPLRSLGPVVRRIRHHGERHIHAHFAEAAALNAMRLSRLLGIPYSVTAHAYDIYKDPRNLPEKLDKARFVTSGCDYNVRNLRELLGPPAAERVHEIVMGIDGQKFRRRNPYPGGRHVAAVGRLVEKKGFDDLIEAAAILRERAPIDSLSVVGDGPLREQLAALVRERGLDGTVRLLGWREPSEVRELLEDVDLLAMPSVVAGDGDRDSMPVVVKEALAMEVPVVASDEVGLPELVHDGWGRLVPPSRPDALARAIDEVLSLSAERRTEMGRRGRDFVLEHADLRSESAKLSELIEAAA